MPNADSRILITDGDQKYTMSFSELLSHVHRFGKSILKSIDSCITFYSDPGKKYSGPWNPFWVGPNYDRAEPYLKAFDDPFVEQVALVIADAWQKRYELVVQMTQFLATYWGYGEIKTRKDSFKIGNKRSRIKKGDPLPWVEEAEFKVLLNRFFELKAEITPICDQLEDHLIQTYNYGYIKDFGDQKAKDLIDFSYNAKPKTALKYLNKAISYGRPTFMSSKAYHCMGDTYKFLGDMPAAIEAYTNGIKDYEAMSVNMNNHLMVRYLFLARGLCYWEIEDFEQGARDIKIATRGVTDPNQFSPHEKMYLDAVEKLAQGRE